MNNATMRRLGDYIRQVDVRNRDLAVTNLVGLSIDKVYIPSVANTVGTDLSNYKIIRENQFACSLMQVSRDKKMPIAVYKGEDAIMSPAYPIFEITDESLLLPDYLHLWFVRPEFDREVTFYAVGGVRGSLEWDDFCDLQIPVPPIEEQREIVARHKAIEHKIDVNRRLIAKLEETARTIFRHTFVENIDPENLPEGMYWTTILGFCKEIKSGGTPNRSNKKYWEKPQHRWLKTGEVHNCIIHDTEEYISETGLQNSAAKLIEKGSVIMAMYGATAAQVGFLDCEAATNQACCNMTCYTEAQAAYLYFHLLEKRDEIKRLANGGAQENLSQELIANQSIIGIIEDSLLTPFKSILTQIIVLSNENRFLTTTKKNLTL